MATPDQESLPFPPGFLWGAATSPTQVEGHIENEWTQFTARTAATAASPATIITAIPKTSTGCPGWGSNAYRFGIEWSRLQSAPFAPLNPDELAHYVDVLDRLRAAGITPMVVLHHFSNPAVDQCRRRLDQCAPPFRRLWITSASWWPRSKTAFTSGTRSTSRTPTRAWRICWAAFRRNANGSSASSAG